MTVGILLALCSVAMLIYFVGHVAGRINVDSVIALVGDDLQRSLRSIGSEQSHDAIWHDATVAPEAIPIRAQDAGYLQRIDIDSLAQWAVSHGACWTLTIRPGHYVFPGATAGWVHPPLPDADRVLTQALVLGAERTPYADLEYAVRQLVEVGMRALSPGINDPYSAVSVIDRLGGALCELAALRLPSGQTLRGGRLVVSIPAIDYDGLTDTMFHPLRQHGSGNAMVLIRLLEVFEAVASCESDPGRRMTLRRHADLVLSEGTRTLNAPADLRDLRARHGAFRARLAEPVNATS